MTQQSLPQLRKLSYQERIALVRQRLSLSQEEAGLLSEEAPLADLSDVLIETAIGVFGLPWGIAQGFCINGKEYLVPMATEEPSVIAAATHGAMLARSGGGFNASSTASLVTAQIFIEEALQEAPKRVEEAKKELAKTVNELMPNMVQRGGGFRNLSVEKIPATSTLCISIELEVCNAMGANIANSVAEGLRAPICALTGGRITMAILTNASDNRLAYASFCIPEKYLKKGSLTGEEVCRRIVQANQIAVHYPKRAVTHNKGIMNGISALTLATGNDTRAIEAAAHFHAQSLGSYRALTNYRYEAGLLYGEITVPVPLGTVGGAITIWPYARIALKILENPDAQKLGEIAASLGLAQNLAALYALVTDGIQAGHMPLHAARVAYQAGARGKQVRAVAQLLWQSGIIQESEAKKILTSLKNV